MHVSCTANNSYGGQALLLAKVVGGTTTYPFRGDTTGSSTRGTFPVGGFPDANYGYPDVTSGTFLDTAGSTNAITYKIQHIDQSTNNLIYINREHHGTGGAFTDYHNFRNYNNGGISIMSELRTNRIVPRDGLVSGASGGIIQVVQQYN